MKKIDSRLLVCTSEQTQQLMGMGILPIAAFCYEWVEVEPTKGKRKKADEPEKKSGYEYAGEYMGEGQCIPAWTMEELQVMCGGDYGKPDLIPQKDFRPCATQSDFEFEMKNRMMRFSYDYPKVKKYYENGAIAMADYLIYLLENKVAIVKDCNVRLENFYTKPFILL